MCEHNIADTAKKIFSMNLGNAGDTRRTKLDAVLEENKSLDLQNVCRGLVLVMRWQDIKKHSLADPGREVAYESWNHFPFHPTRH